MHLPFDHIRYSCHAGSNVKCDLYEINKNNMPDMDRVWSKNVPRPNRSSVGPERSRTRTSTCTNTTYLDCCFDLLL